MVYIPKPPRKLEHGQTMITFRNHGAITSTPAPTPAPARATLHSSVGGYTAATHIASNKRSRSPNLSGNVTPPASVKDSTKKQKVHEDLEDTQVHHALEDITNTSLLNSRMLDSESSQQKHTRLVPPMVIAVPGNDVQLPITIADSDDDGPGNECITGIHDKLDHAENGKSGQADAANFTFEQAEIAATLGIVELLPDESSQATCSETELKAFFESNSPCMHSNYQPKLCGANLEATATLYEASHTISGMLIQHCLQINPSNAETKGLSFYTPGSWTKLRDINPNEVASMVEKIFDNDILHEQFSSMEELLNILPDIDLCQLRKQGRVSALYLLYGKDSLGFTFGYIGRTRHLLRRANQHLGRISAIRACRRAEDFQKLHPGSTQHCHRILGRKDTLVTMKVLGMFPSNTPIIIEETYEAIAMLYFKTYDSKVRTSTSGAAARNFATSVWSELRTSKMFTGLFPLNRSFPPSENLTSLTMDNDKDDDKSGPPRFRGNPKICAICSADKSYPGMLFRTHPDDSEKSLCRTCYYHLTKENGPGRSVEQMEYAKALKVAHKEHPYPSDGCCENPSCDRPVDIAIYSGFRVVDPGLGPLVICRTCKDKFKEIGSVPLRSHKKGTACEHCQTVIVALYFVEEAWKWFCIQCKHTFEVSDVMSLHVFFLL